MPFHIWLRRNLTAIQLAKHSIYSVAIFVVVQLIDRRVVDWIVAIPSFLKTTQALSQTMLAALAAALLTITTFSFASILTLLNHYSSNYSPRIVENILNRNSVMSVVGMNAGGFLFSILALAFGADVGPSEMVTAGMAAALYSVASIIYFIYFVHGVSVRVKSSYIIESLYQEADAVIAAAASELEPARIHRTTRLADPRPVRSQANGFFEGVDIPGIFELFTGQSGQLEITIPIGKHVVAGDQLATLSLDSVATDDEVASVLECFQVTQEKEVNYDYHFGVTKLVEIALRAISPGINDPNTAIHCIYQIGTLTGHIASFRDDTPTIRVAGDFEICQIERPISAELNSSYEQLIHYGKADISVVRALFEALQITYDHAAETNRKAIAEFEQYLYDSVAPQFPLPIDQAKIAAHRLNHRFK